MAGHAELGRDGNAVAALDSETEMAFRRVMRYPLHWRDLSTAELELLSHGARAIHPGGRRATYGST